MLIHYKELHCTVTSYIVVVFHSPCGKVLKSGGYNRQEMYVCMHILEVILYRLVTSSGGYFELSGGWPQPLLTTVGTSLV